MTIEIVKFYDNIDKLKENIEKIIRHIASKKNLDSNEVSKYLQMLDEYHEKLNLVKTMNVRKPIELFYENVVISNINPIINMDDEFIFNKANELKESEEFEPHEINILDFIRTIWDLIDDDTKKNIWIYIKTICILSERINGNCLLFNAIQNKKHK